MTEKSKEDSQPVWAKRFSDAALAKPPPRSEVVLYIQTLVECMINQKRVIGELHERLARLESQGVKYCGVYQRAQDYRRGNLVTADGSMWAAVRDVQAGEEPGQSKAWQLAVKAGRGGR